VAKSRGPKSNAVSIHRMCSADLGCVNVSQLIVLLLVDHNLPLVFCSVQEGSCLMTLFTACRYHHLFQKYVQLNLKVVLNHAKFTVEV